MKSGNDAEADRSDMAEQRVDTRTLIILAFSATAGVMVEFYDFFFYGYAAARAFLAIFFPRLPPTQAVVFSYMAFGAGFSELGCRLPGVVAAVGGDKQQRAAGG